MRRRALKTTKFDQELPVCGSVKIKMRDFIL
jgi:hypothetical protein